MIFFTWFTNSLHTTALSFKKISKVRNSLSLCYQNNNSTCRYKNSSLLPSKRYKECTLWNKSYYSMFLNKANCWHASIWSPVSVSWKSTMFVANRKKVELHKNTTSNFLGPTLEYTKRLHQRSYDLQVAIGKTWTFKNLWPVWSKENTSKSLTSPSPNIPIWILSNAFKN